jgi:hypothetical protein
MAEWMASDLSRLDLVAIQIDGIHVKEELLLVAAVGIDAGGRNIRSAWSKAPRRMPRPHKPSSIT